MSEEEDDPLEDLYTDKNSFDRERLVNALKGVIGVDQDTAEPIFMEGYHKLSNKQKFVAQLLYRRVIVALGEIDKDDIGISGQDAADHVDVSDSAIRNYSRNLDFVESDPDGGGYYLPTYAIERATEFIADDS